MSNNEKIKELLEKYKNGEVDENEMMKSLTIREQMPQRPYFRMTRSKAIGLYGVRRDPIVLYRQQWLRLSKAFSGGKKCAFNHFFFYEEKKKVVKEDKSSEVDEVLVEEQMEELK
jgi:hypothetical protein